MDPNDTLPPPSPEEDNPGTQLPVGPGPRLPPAALEEAYAVAREGMAKAPAGAAGYRLFWVRGQEIGWRDLPVGGAYAILGRHTECDAVLRADPSLSLRHVLATTVALADGIALRLLDLQTAVPFYLQDSTARRSVVACGAVVARLGDYVIGGVPIEEGPSGPLLSLGALPRAVVTDSAEPPRSIVSALGASARSDRFDFAPVTHVTSIPPPRSVADAPRPRVVEGRPLSPGARARLTLRRGNHRAAVDLTDAELDLGVLIGRAERCHDDGLQAVLDNNISRGHLLLLHHHDTFEAFDLCSTQGTFKDGTPVRRVLFSNSGNALTLGSVDAVRLDLLFRTAEGA